MLELMQYGGIPMWVILLFGGVGLAASGLFARRPEPHKLRPLVALGLATLFATLSGSASCFARVCTRVAGNPEWVHSPELVPLLLQGVGESLAPCVLGFSLLALGAFVSAVGLRRMPRS